MTKYHFPTKAALIGDGGGQWGGSRTLILRLYFFLVQHVKTSKYHNLRYRLLNPSSTAQNSVMSYEAKYVFTWPTITLQGTYPKTTDTIQRPSL